jgi:hypothetical protein
MTIIKDTISQFLVTISADVNIAEVIDIFIYWSHSAYLVY